MINQNIVGILNTIESASGLNTKKQLLADYIKNDVFKKDLYDIFCLALDRKNVFGISDKTLMSVLNISTLEGWQDIGHYIEGQYWNADEINSDDCGKNMVEAVRLYSGNELKEQLELILSSLNSQAKKWVCRIWLKDLRLGINKDTINKILVKEGLNPIDEFVVQLCEKIETLADVTLPFPVICQTKYDGTRVIATINNYQCTLKSRADKDCTEQFPEIVKALTELYKANNFKEELVLDGEVISKSFNDLQTRLGRKAENITESDDLSYVIYDIRTYETVDIRNKAYVTRLDIIQKLTLVPKITLVETVLAYDNNDVEAFYKAKLLKGEEGIVIKDKLATYAIIPKNDRKGQWKYKPVLECTLEVIDKLKGSGKNSALFTRLVCKDKSGTVESVVSNMSDEDINVLNHGTPAQFIDVAYLQISVDQKGNRSLRHPRFIKWRYDKTEADTL